MLSANPLHAVPMAAKEKAFYQQLGQRIAERRKQAGITQVELAQVLGVAQQTLAHYEGGVSRIAVALLPPLAKTLGTSIEDLIGEPVRTTSKRGPAPRLLQQIERITELPKPQQKFVMQMLETVLAQSSR